MMARSAMAERREPGPGEKALRAKGRARAWILAGCLALGMVIGVALGLADKGPGKNLLTDFSQLSLSPMAAVPLAIVVAAALVALPLWLFTQVDELKVLRNMQAMVGGWFAVIGGYPAWLLLSAGGLASPPNAMGLFLLAYGVSLLVFLVLKFRD